MHADSHLIHMLILLERFGFSLEEKKERMSLKLYNLSAA